MNQAVLAPDNHIKRTISSNEQPQFSEVTSNNEGRQPLLAARNLVRNYGSFQALQGISFDMQPGEIISVLGPSGCGKSTLLQVIAGLTKPDGGELSLNGELIASSRSMLPPEKRGVNMVFQDYALWPHMSVYENIAYGLRRKRMPSTEMDKRVRELLDLLQLTGLEKRLPPQLSGGQQQRVGIARALATRPQLLLLDEPLSNLDMRLRVEMRTEMALLFRELGTSVFHVTHDPEEAFAMADRLLIMRAGRIDQMGTPQQCFQQPASRQSASLLGAINNLRGKLIWTGSQAFLELGTTGQSLKGILPPHYDRDSSPAAAQGEMLFRPEDVEIVEEDAGSEGSLPVTVLRSIFEGNSWRSAVITDCGQKLFLLQAAPLEQGTRKFVKIPEPVAFLFPMDS